MSLPKELLIPESKAGCPSNSDDSFHNVNSYLDTSNGLRMTLVEEPNFLAFAVYYNLDRYV